MKKVLYVIFIISLSILASASVFAESINGSAIFMIDTDLAQAGYQGFTSPTGIEAGQYVGFGIYVAKVDQLTSFSVDITWDPALASRYKDSDVLIEEDDININGQDITLAEEENVLGSVTGLGEVKEDGHYYNGYAKLGDSIAQEGFGLLYFSVLKTSDTFSASKSLIVVAKITIGSGGAEAPRYIGQRYFYVNSSGTDVQDSTWGEIKSQFKDF